ncbi:unnamed protein product, partial [Mesorhabditis belari]|uniref:Protein FAM98A n=1 Tax=Mesorhabditis belari TaxID=2138241 RepID=A0AAF3JAX1_9BILA
MSSMEVDKSTTFSCHNLKGIQDILGYDNFAPIIEQGLGTLDFFKLLHTLCTEIKVLDELQESPSAIQSLDEAKAFLYELSAFLTELDCGISDLLSGSLEERFSSTTRRYALIDFLINELKVARVLADEKLKAPVKVIDTALAQDLDRAIQTLKMPAPKIGDERDIVAKIMVEANKRCQVLKNPPRPLFTEKMDDLKWAAVDRLCHQMSADVRARNLLLLKRIDVTVNSFLWADKVRKREKEILDLYAEKRKDMAKVFPPDVISLLACSNNHLLIERASCSRLRQHTKSKVQPVANAEAPKDRGGRTNEVAAPSRETFLSQQLGRGDGGRGQWHGGRGGHGGHGGHGGRGHGGGNQNYQQSGGSHHSVEDQARNEYQQRRDHYGGQDRRGGNRGGSGGGYQRGRGGGRGYMGNY